MNKKKIVILIVVVTVGVVGALILKTINAPPVVVTSDNTALLVKNYINDDYGFSFNYPADWEVPAEDPTLGCCTTVNIYNLRTTVPLLNTAMPKLEGRGKLDNITTLSPIKVYVNLLLSKNIDLDLLVKNECDSLTCDNNNIMTLQFLDFDARRYQTLAQFGSENLMFIRQPYQYRIMMRNDEQTKKMFDMAEVLSTYNLVLSSFKFNN